MADTFETFMAALDSPAENAATVTPNDGADLTNATRGIICSEAGTVTVDMVGTGTNIAIPCQAGINPIRVTRIYSTGTSAGTIVALW